MQGAFRPTQAPLSALRSLPALALVSVLMACGTGAATRSPSPEPGLIVRLNETFYDIEGATVAAVDSSLTSRRPSRGDGVSVAETDWDARLDYRTREELDGCRVERVRLELVFTVSLPRLATHIETSSELATYWKRFLAAIRFHEAGHQDITVREAAGLIRDLKELRARTCGELERRAALARDRFLVNARSLNERYDFRTQNGRRDGVLWPPDH